MRKSTRIIVLLSALLFATTALARADLAEDQTASYLRSLEATPDNRAALRTFFTLMPKGADIHNHLTGAVDAEDYVDWAVADGDCYLPTTFALAAPPCRAPAIAVTDDPLLRRALVDAFSMHDFVASAGESGHDHFFDAFAKFNAVTDAHKVAMAQNALLHAGLDRVSYVELMMGFSSAASPLVALARNTPLDPAQLDAAMRSGVAAAVAAASRSLSAIEGPRAAACMGRADAPECRPAVRYIDAVNRTAEPRTVFAQALLAFELARTDGRVVGVNLVSPEDNPVALRDYGLQMLMFNYLHAKYPMVHISLHAGELTLGLVPLGDLQDHIRRAVLVGEAERIGHGVDIAGEQDAAFVLGVLARQKTLVEIALTSNDVILGVRGYAHPLPLYLAAGVPTALVTDDEGVSRIDLTNEFVRAAATYDLSYAQMKAFARNSLEYSFAPGASLWAGHDYTKPVADCATFSEQPTRACADRLAQSVKMALEYRLETDLRAFERTIATRPDP